MAEEDDVGEKSGGNRGNTRVPPFVSVGAEGVACASSLVYTDGAEFRGGIIAT